MYLTQLLFSRGKFMFMALSGLILLSACNKNVLFTSNSSVTAPPAGVAADSTKTEKTLKRDDKVLISVWDHAELSVGSLQSSNSLDEDQGKWLMIDANGEVRLPQVGNVKLQGLTVREATLYLEQVYAKFIQNPVVTVRVLNNQVTVLGEVRSPGNYMFSSDNIRLVDVIGKALGFTDYAKTRKVKVIRGSSEMIVDFTNRASVAAKELTILPGDVIYVPPTTGKAWERFDIRLIPIASLITAIALVYSVSQK